MTLKHLTLTLRDSLATKAVRSPAGHSLSLESTTSSLSLLAPAGVDITSQSGHVNIQVSKRLAAVIIAVSCVFRPSETWCSAPGVTTASSGSTLAPSSCPACPPWRGQSNTDKAYNLKALVMFMFYLL